MFKLANSDCKKAFKFIKDETINLICTDPPYRVSSGGSKSWNEQHKNKKTIFGENDGKVSIANDLSIKDWIYECYRVLKKDSEMYIFTNNINLTEYLVTIQNSGFKLHNVLVWKKNNCLPNKFYMKNCEYIIYAYKGHSRTINNPGSKTVLEFDSVPSKDRTHPTEKPVPLIETLVGNSTNKGDTVLDFAMGTGSCGVACGKLKRNFIGIEIDKNFYTIAQKRIKNAT